jgi:hypothetical protein
MAFVRARPAWGFSAFSAGRRPVYERLLGTRTVVGDLDRELHPVLGEPAAQSQLPAGTPEVVTGSLMQSALHTASHGDNVLYGS